MSKYVFKPYSKIFPDLFNKEKGRIAPFLKRALAIEHIGSTSVCNLGGKGIIDIAIAVNKEDMDTTSQQLQSLGYEFRPTFSTPDRLYFIIYLPDPEEGNRRYHVHLTYPESSDWKGFISFRDYLRAHPEEVQEYAEMKKRAAREANQEGNLYRKIKEPIFQKIKSLVHEADDFEKISIETVTSSSLQDAIAFLRKHEDFSLFLLGNLEAHGHKLTSAPNSGNLKLLRRGGKIVAVFCLTRRGNLVVQSEMSDRPLMEKIITACQEEELSILGLLGQWDFCRSLWNLFREKAIILHDTFIEKESLYAVELSKQALSDEPNVRILLAGDYPQWKPLHIEYLKEEGFPNDLSKEQTRALFLEKVAGKISWGYFLEQRLVAMAELNAKAMDLGQVGGVYTTPTQRKKGFAQAVMRQVMTDARNVHQIRKLIIFTGENNLPARKLYESLGVHPTGSYALMFGNKNNRPTFESHSV
jgi:GrpB-like predicted nucleotidyltransferase (UPF0157 family)/predicted GNAT family acetyltransferase